MSLIIQAKGLNETLRVFETRKVSPFFAIYQNRTILEQNCSNDMEEAIEKISNFFSTGSGYESTPLTFKMYASHKKGNNDKEPVYASFMFTVSSVPVLSGSNGGDSGLHYVITDLKNQINGLTSEINALKESEESEDEAEPEKDNFMSGVNEFLSHPTINAIIGLLTEKLFMNPNDQKVTKLAGIDDNKASAYQYVEILLAKGVTIEHLQKLAEMPKAKIKTLLMML